MKIQRLIKQNPQKKYLVVWLFAGHGILTGGMQSIVINEFDRFTKFYRTYKVESAISALAAKNPNSYMITIFACCRQLHNEKSMTGCINQQQKSEIEQNESLEAMKKEAKEIEDSNAEIEKDRQSLIELSEILKFATLNATGDKKESCKTRG